MKMTRLFIGENMKRNLMHFILLASLLTLVSFHAGAQSKAASSTGCSISPSTLDFGVMTTGQRKTDSVTILNTGGIILMVTNITSGSAEFFTSTKQLDIDPHDSARIAITCLPTIPGDKVVRILFSDNSYTNPDTLTVKVKAIGDTALPVASAIEKIDFGTVATCTTKMDTFFVANTGKSPLFISLASSTNSHFAIDPKSATIGVGESLPFTARYAPVSAGADSTTITLWHNGRYGKTVITASALATGPDCRPTFSAAPHDFGYVQTGVLKTDSITFTNNGTAALSYNVSKYSGDGSFTIVPSTGYVPRGSSVNVAARFYSTTPGLKHGTVILVMNTVSGKDSISFTGVATGDTLKPQFALSKTSIDFGPVVNGKTKQDSVIISNPGTYTLEVNAIYRTNALFTVSQTMAYISPGTSEKILVTFAPMTDGIQTGKIFFSHNVGQGKDSITVTGEGTGGAALPLFSAMPKLLHMDNVPNNTFAHDSFTVWNHGRATLHVTSTKRPNQFFSASPFLFDVPVDSFVTVHVNLTAMYSGTQTVYFLLTSDAPSSPDTVTVIANIVKTGLEPVMTLASHTFDFGSVQWSHNKADSILITNTGKQPLKITKITSKSSQFAIDPLLMTINPSESAYLKVVFQPANLGELSAWIIFNFTSEPYFDTIRVHGICTPLANTSMLFTDPKTLDFRGILRNTTKLDSIKVYNLGKSQLSINNVSSSNGTFSSNLSATEISPNEFAIMEVEFFPRDTMQQFGQIVFTSNAPETYDTLFVTGQGLLLSDIQATHAMPNGTEVAVQGIVTRAEGNWARVQDATGAIAIYQNGGRFFNAISAGDIHFGDYMLIEGRTSEMNAMKVISGDDLNDYKVISHKNPLPAPVKLTLADIAASGEQYENRLITVVALTIASEGDLWYQAGKLYRISDASDKSNAVSLRIPDFGDTQIDGQGFLTNNVDFVGVLAQDLTAPGTGYELFPVFESDLRVGSTGNDELTDAVPLGFALLSNYPNPFSGATMLRYSLPEASVVSLEVHDLLGRIVARPVDREFAQAGVHTVRFNAGDLQSGVYCCVLASGGRMQRRFISLVR